jgi:hypothetical protein
MNIVQVILSQQTFDVLGALLLMSGRRVYFGDRDPLTRNVC